MKKTALLFLLISLFQPNLFAQDHKLDSLNHALINAKHDSTRLRIYIALCDACPVKDNLRYGEAALQLTDKLLPQTKNEKEKNQLLECKADLYNYLLVYYADLKNDSPRILEYMQKRLAIYEEINNTEKRITTLRALSNYYIAMGNYPEGINYLNNALAVAKAKNFKKGIAGCLYHMAGIYNDQGEHAQALENYKQASAIYTSVKDTIWIAAILLSEGGIYSGLHNIPKALECYNRSIALYELKKIKQEVRRGYSCIGNMYVENNKAAEALVNFEKCMAMSVEMNDNYWIGITSGNMARIYAQQANYSRAIENNLRSLKIFKELNEEGQVANAYRSLAAIYLKLKAYAKATVCIDSAIVLEKSKKYLSNLKESELLATEIDSAKGDHKGAFAHYKQYIALSNKLKSEAIKQAATKEKYQNEYAQRKETDKKEQEKKDAVAKAELNQQTFQRNAFVGGFGLMLILAGVSYSNFRRKQKDNKIITHQKYLVEEKQKEILDSITYALRIQTAILPPQKVVKHYLENSFILYKPKDIVAGDFYWMETVQSADEKEIKNNQINTSSNKQISELDGEKRFKNNRLFKSSAKGLILFAACDCTGHGVPGAMVSVVCNNALNRAIREFGLTQPAAILDKTAEIVIENFSKSEEDIKDGMDISLCAYDANAKTIQWAGANNPLWIVQNGTLIETKADKQPIGLNEDVKPFTNHTFNVNSGDSIYIFTDGFADQFGGENGQKKLTRKRFRDLILSLQNKTMQEQGIALDSFITDYRKDVEQIDDILVIGVKI